jgi:hypothetical protein
MTRKLDCIIKYTRGGIISGTRATIAIVLHYYYPRHTRITKEMNKGKS